MCGNYIVQAEKHTALPNQRYLWFASMDFLTFFTNYKQDHRLEITIKFNSLVWPTFEKIIDFSMHNVYWDTLYVYFKSIKLSQRIVSELKMLYLLKMKFTKIIF